MTAPAPILEIQGDYLRNHLPAGFIVPNLLSIVAGQCERINWLSDRAALEVIGHIIGLRRPAVGAIRLFSEDVGRIGRGRFITLRRRLGALTAPVILAPELSVRDNLELPCLFKGMNTRQTRFAIDRIVEEMRLQDILSLRTERLSFAESRVAAIARAMVHDPELVILEAPLAGLDEFRQRIVNEQILRVSSRGSALMIFHDASVESQVIDLRSLLEPDTGV